MATILGTAVNFGFTGTDGIAATQFTGKIILQNIDYAKMGDEEQIKDAVGVLVSRIFYNPGEKATLEYIPKGADIATALTNTSVPDRGTIISVTTCANIPALVNTHWVVVGEPKISGSNTASKKVTLDLEAHASVTAAAS